MQPLEVLVVDDCSKSENIRRVIEICRYFGFRLITRDENGGASAARNDGIRKARGDYIQFVDSDDLLTPNSLEIKANLFRKSPESLWAAGESLLVPTWYSYKPNRSLSAIKGLNFFCKRYPLILPEDVPHDDPHKVRWHHCAILYKRELFERYGMYDERLSVSEDKELRWRFWYSTKTFPVHTSKIVYLIRQGNRRDRLTLSGGDKTKWRSIINEKMEELGANWSE
jgi:glycosyltransferase involved in cell wall biosynthesis